MPGSCFGILPWNSYTNHVQSWRYTAVFQRRWVGRWTHSSLGAARSDLHLDTGAPQPRFYALLIYSSSATHTHTHTVSHTHTHTVAVHGAGQVYGSQLAGNNSSPDPTPAFSSNSSQNLYNLQFPRFSTWSFLDININQWLYLLTGEFPFSLKMNGG